MFRLLALCLLLGGLAAGCASENPEYAATYCLVGRSTPCSQMTGDGFCQPCPAVGFRQAEGEVPTVR